MWDRYQRAVLLFFAIALFLAVAYVTRRALLLIWVSILVAVMLTPLVHRIHQIRIRNWQPSRGASVLILALVLFGILGLISVFFVPPILHDETQLEQQWPHRCADMMNWIHRHVPFGNHISLEQLKRSARDMLGNSFSVSAFGNHVVEILTMLLVAAYFIVDGPRAFHWLVGLFPVEDQPRIYSTLSRGGRRMQQWLAGQGLLMLIHGASATIVFAILRIKYFYALGVFAGIINIIPVLGPIITLVVAGAVAAISSVTKLIGVVIFYVIYHNVENAFLNPRIMEAKVRIPAVTVVVALVLGEAIAGIVGILISVPTAVLVSVLINEFLAHRRIPAVQQHRPAA